MNQEEEKLILRKLFNEVDPVGLASDEAPDEYDLEIRQLVSLSP